jgi:hypothetical protein
MQVKDTGICHQKKRCCNSLWLYYLQLPSSNMRMNLTLGSAIGLYYRRDRRLKEHECQLRVGKVSRVMALLNNVVIGLVKQAGLSNLAAARRTYDANPQEAVNLLLRYTY